MNVNLSQSMNNICRVVNICEIVLKYIKANFVNQTKLAEEIGTSKSNLSNRLHSTTIDTLMLYNLSVALKHDFFQYLSMDLTKKSKVDIIEDPSITKPYFKKEEYVHLLEENIELYRKLHKEKEEGDSLRKNSKAVHPKLK